MPPSPARTASTAQQQDADDLRAVQAAARALFYGTKTSDKMRWSKIPPQTPEGSQSRGKGFTAAWTALHTDFVKTQAIIGRNELAQKKMEVHTKQVKAEYAARSRVPTTAQATAPVKPATPAPKVTQQPPASRAGTPALPKIGGLPMERQPTRRPGSQLQRGPQASSGPAANTTLALRPKVSTESLNQTGGTRNTTFSPKTPVAMPSANSPSASSSSAPPPVPTRPAPRRGESSASSPTHS